jgi:hypothetical protein
MDRYFYNFVYAFPDCDRLTQKYGLDRCLTACKSLCDALDSDSEELFRTDIHLGL